MTQMTVAGGTVELAARRQDRRFRGPLLVTLALLVVAELAVRLAAPSLTKPQAWPTPELQHKFDRIRQLADNHGVDVVLVGDSMMDAGGDAAGLAAANPGLRIYNASLAGETLPTLLAWTTKVVVPRLRPRMVVIGLSSNSLNAGAGDDAVARAYTASRVVRDAEGVGDPLDQIDGWLRRWSALYRYRTVLRQPIRSGGTKHIPGQVAVFDPPLSPSGQDLDFAGNQYLEDSGVRFPLAQVRAQVVANLLNHFTVGRNKSVLIRKMITTLQHRGVQVLVVNMPVTADYVSFHPGGGADYQQAVALMRDAVSSSGAAFSSPGIWPTDLFADPVHLNAAGTARFSSILAPLIGSARPSAAAP